MTIRTPPRQSGLYLFGIHLIRCGARAGDAEA